MRKDAIIKRVAMVFDDYGAALKQAYFSSEKRTMEIIPNSTLHPEDNNNNNNNHNNINHNNQNNSHNNNSNNNEKNRKDIKEVIKNVIGNKEHLKNHNRSGVVEIIAQNPEMKSAFKKLSDMLSPYLKDNSTDVIKIINCYFIIYFRLN